MPPPRPPYLRPGLVLPVVAGGASGTLVRGLLFERFPVTAGQWPWTTLAVNVSGAFLLGLLLRTLALGGPDVGVRRLIRLGVGTGVLGGYTTYSTFAVESASLGGAGQLWMAAAYDGASLVSGFVAAWLGFLLAEARPQRARTGDRGRS